MENRRCNLTGDHVDFIAIGQRDDHIGIVRTGVLEQPRIGTVTADGAYIETILQIRQNLLIGIDNGDFVSFFLGKLRRYRRAYLAGT
jgi:hypothetical protein